MDLHSRTGTLVGGLGAMTRTGKPFPLRIPRFDPKTYLCRACRKKVVQEPKSFIAIRGGGLALEDEALQAYGPSESLLGFLNLFWYGDCSRDSEPQVPESTLIRVVANASEGQFEIRVCSLRCLRRFFRLIEDELKVAIAAMKGKPLGRDRRKGAPSPS
jgi:hypothetical protein